MYCMDIELCGMIFLLVLYIVVVDLFVVYVCMFELCM